MARSDPPHMASPWNELWSMKCRCQRGQEQGRSTEAQEDRASNPQPTDLAKCSTTSPYIQAMSAINMTTPIRSFRGRKSVHPRSLHRPSRPIMSALFAQARCARHQAVSDTQTCYLWTSPTAYRPKPRLTLVREIFGKHDRDRDQFTSGASHSPMRQCS